MNKIRGLGLAFGLALMTLVAAGAASADGWNSTQACNPGQSSVSLQIGYGSGAAYGGYGGYGGYGHRIHGSRYMDRRVMMRNDHFGRNPRGSRNDGWQNGGRQFGGGQFGDRQFGGSRGSDHSGSNGGWNSSPDHNRDHDGDGD